MFMLQARKLCPSLVVLRYDFLQYEKISKELYRICLAFCPRVQPVSVDELYLECPSGVDVRAAAEELRQQVLTRTGCRASAGGTEQISALFRTDSSYSSFHLHYSHESYITDRS